MVRINLMKLSSTFLFLCVLIEFWAALIAAQKYNFDTATKKEIQKKLLLMLGMQNPPVIKSDSPIVKSVSKDLYEMYYSTNSFLDHSNTVRMFVHNESDIDTRFDSLHKFRLYFNLTSIPKNEVLKVSELILKSANNKTRQMDDNDQVHVFIYDILQPGSNQNKLVKKLIVKKKLQIDRESSFKFDISSTVKRWMKDHKSNHGILVKTYESSRKNQNKLTKSTGKIRLKRSANHENNENSNRPLKHEQPILVTFTDDSSESGEISRKNYMQRTETTEKVTTTTTATTSITTKAESTSVSATKVTSTTIPLPSSTSPSRNIPMGSTAHNTSNHSHSKRRNRNKRNPLKHRKKSHRNEGACRRRNLYVPFSEVGWNNWIVAPTGVEIFYCSGSCDYPLDQHFNTTNHAIVQTMINTINPSVIPKSCCVPTSLAPLSLLYVEDESKVVLRNYQNMQVLGCGCL